MPLSPPVTSRPVNSLSLTSHPPPPTPIVLISCKIIFSFLTKIPSENKNPTKWQTFVSRVGFGGKGEGKLSKCYFVPVEFKGGWGGCVIFPSSHFNYLRKINHNSCILFGARESLRKQNWWKSQISKPFLQKFVSKYIVWSWFNSRNRGGDTLCNYWLWGFGTLYIY